MIGRLIAGVFALLMLVALAVLIAVGLMFRSVPPRGESREVAGLEQPATIELDSSGVPVLRARSLADLSFLSGWAHARDRRFQMELQRRSAAGRLSEVVGRVALPADRRMRTFGFAAVAESAAARLDPARHALYEAYAAGVNAWDRAHPAPPECSLLKLKLEPWRVEDCLLTVLVMFEELNDAGGSEQMVERMDATLPPALVAFLLPDSTPSDVPLAGARAPAPPPIPDETLVDLRQVAPAAAFRGPLGPARRLAWLERGDERARGSNNWAIAPSRTSTGGAILAGDPHLGLRVPVIWHRQRLEGAGLAVTGVTLPGAPGVIAGSNGRVAWSLTNVEPDVADLVRFDLAGEVRSSYVGPHGPEPFRVREEVIAIKGARPETLRVMETRWGPVIGESASGGQLALQWTALDPWMLDFDVFAMNRAGSVRELLDAIAGFRGPPQNWVAADRDGHIGWRIGGCFPRRSGFDPRRPREAADSTAGWNGYLTADSLPAVIDPPQGFLVTANQRTLGAAWLPRIGREYAMPWRARRIHDALAAREGWSVEDVSALQNDVADLFLETTALALDRALTPEACAASDTLARVRRLLDAWTHRADTTSVAHGVLRYARLELNRAVQAPLVAPCIQMDSTFSYDWPLADEVTRRLLTERPGHLLDPAFDDWDELVRAAARRAVITYAAAASGTVAPFDSIPWGRINRAAIHHPLGNAVPALGRWLNMPNAALAGGSSVVRVARPRSGASMRMVADLANPSASRFVMPGGQSGHFLSPHFGDLFADWVAGRTRPLEPGRVSGTTRLTPARR